MRHSRRSFINSAIAVTTAAACASNPAVVYAEDDVTARYRTRPVNGFDPIHLVIHQIEDIYNRHWILSQAAQILHTNFRHPRVAENAYNIPTLAGWPAYFVSGDAYEKSNIAAHPTYSVARLLLYQLEILRLPDSAQEDDDEGPPFPKLHIYPMHEENDVHGRASVGTVSVKYMSETSARRSGEFEVKVNLWHLGADGIGSEPRHWASVIAHEMLHNLGHRHELMEYDDGRQINAFHRTVYCGGEYDGDRSVGNFGCRPTI